MIEQLLIANRGEIARRIIATCRRLGVSTVAVYSDADVGAPHVHEADQAVRLGPAPAAQSYLDIERLLDAARRSGADAVHPGYGFLAESADFASAVRDAGLIFVGPDAEVIRLMGDKAAAKRRLEKAGVPVVPGTLDDDLDDDALADAAADIGYPVLVKAVAGGGGKGMRTVTEPSGIGEAVAAARRESRGAFGDDRLIVERFVAAPRHVEIQIFGDSHGQVIHLGERECSIQRRHQKIVEESPSPAVDDDLRAAMGKAAVAAAETVGYVGAGTVELILEGADADGTAPTQPKFFFMEMNTRLQVEHPVTEMVTGLDLVEWQLRVAAGDRLPLTQDEITTDGHALEVRLYAEDPAAGFLPQTGPVHHFATPLARDVRVDAGITDGVEVSAHYDPMLAKLVVHAPDRATSIERMRWLLARTAVLGVVTNVEFLAAVVAHPAFASGSLTTGFVTDHLDGWAAGPTPPALRVAAVVGLLRHHAERRRAVGDPHSPWHSLGPWRTGQVGGWQLTLSDGEASQTMSVSGRADTYQVHDAGDVVEVRVTAADGARLDLEIDGAEVPTTVVVEPGATPGEHRPEGDVVWVHAGGATRRLEVVPATRHVAGGVLSSAAAFTSPMPGSVIEVAVTVGDHVAAGTRLLVVEAMKMEHPITASADGTITAVHVAAGDPVEAGTPLLELDPDDASDESSEVDT